MKRLVRITGRKRKRTAGQALLEFALVLPLLLMLVCAIFDFGWMVFNYSQLYNGLREGLRYGSVTGYDVTAQYRQCDGIRQKIRELANVSGVTDGDIGITYDTGDPATAIGTCPSGLPVSITGDRFTHPCPTPLLPTNFCNGDRIVIRIDITVPFLTPVIRPLLPGGLTFSLVAARSIYPGGLAG